MVPRLFRPQDEGCPTSMAVPVNTAASEGQETEQRDQISTDHRSKPISKATNDTRE